MNAVSLNAFYQSSAAKYFTHDEKYNHCKGIYTKFINKGKIPIFFPNSQKFPNSYEEIDVNDIAVALNYYDDTVTRNALTKGNEVTFWDSEICFHSRSLLRKETAIKKAGTNIKDHFKETNLPQIVSILLPQHYPLHIPSYTLLTSPFLQPLPLLLLLCSRFPPF